ncbi:hypothetical protein [Flavobacterium sp.]|uniref:hypothetical protein n=1 Tax=Flavobacterium sp. TaxID=239 RepID=UPI003D6BC7DF
MADTPEQYYGDENKWGNYQFTSLKEIMDQMLLEATDDDSYLKNTKRSKILMHAKQGIKKLTKEAAKNYLAIEMTVSQDLFLPLPQDYSDYEMICVVTPDFKLMPLNINRNMSLSIGYLQDNDGQILFDEDGLILTSDSSNAYAKPFKKYDFCDDYRGGQFETDTSQLSRWGEVNIDENRGTMVFSSNLMEREIVLIYSSDGLQMEKLLEQEITIHKDLEEPLKDWIYFACIERKRGVPDSEKNRALRRYKTTLHKAKIHRSNFDLNEVVKVMRSSSKML